MFTFDITVSVFHLWIITRNSFKSIVCVIPQYELFTNEYNYHFFTLKVFVEDNLTTNNTGEFVPNQPIFATWSSCDDSYYCHLLTKVSLSG